LVQRFDHEYPERFSAQIFKYLSINNNEFPKEEHLYSIDGEDLKKIQDFSNNFKDN